VLNKQSTQHLILASAIKAIDKGGEAAVQIRKICAESKTTAPTVYYFFGSREGLIEAAQAARYFDGQNAMLTAFDDAVHRCKSKSEFASVVHDYLNQTFSQKRQHARSVRVNVLGSAQSRKSLAKTIAGYQLIANKVAGKTIRYAQEKRWARSDLNPEMFAAFAIGIANAQTIIELDGAHPDREDWIEIATRSICLVLEIPEPKNAKRKSKVKRKPK
jgi:AcrR family transcriptional regulator